VAEALEAGEEAFLTRPGIGPQTLQVVRKWLTEMLVAGKVEIPLAKSSREAVGGGDGCQEARCEVTVVGDGLSRRRLAEWRGAARVGLASLSRQLGEIQLLICAEDDALSIIACWPQGEVTLSDLSPNGRSTQMKTMRRIAQQIRARR
jgi:hypothetical protein